MTRKICFSLVMLLLALRLCAQKAGTVIPAPAAKQTAGYFTQKKLDSALIARMKGKSLPAGKVAWAQRELRYLRVLHCNREGKTQIGELVCNKAIAASLLSVFRSLYAQGYRIERMVLVDEYDGNDDRSMLANNTSCFNYRTVQGTNKLSKHGKGLAIDINPFYNPWVRGNRVDPETARPYAFNRSKLKAPLPIITTSDPCYKIFRKHGFAWGGSWRSSKDYQHFEK